MRALRAFEAAARLSSFTRAAEELGVHQPIVSRYITELEYQIGFQLFERHHRSVSLTPAGEMYHRAITTGLERIASGALSASNIAEDQRVICACSHSFSHHVVMPHFDSLRQVFGENISPRILVVDYCLLQSLGEHESDLIISYDDNTDIPEDRVELFGEAFTPVCSPDFATTHADVLARPIKEWGVLPFLRLAQNYDWATWHDWFEFAGYPSPKPQYISIEDYVYLIEAAISGQGLALGWRGYIDHYLSEGKLVALGDGFVERNKKCFAKLTKRGRQRPIARQCLEAIDNLMNELSSQKREFLEILRSDEQ